MEMIPDAILFMQMGSDVPIGAELLIFGFAILPISTVGTIAELLTVHVVLASMRLLAIGQLIRLLVVAALLMASIAWFPDVAGFLFCIAGCPAFLMMPFALFRDIAGFLLIIVGIPALLALLGDLPVLAWLDARRARPRLPVGARPWSLIGGPALLSAIALGLVTVFYPASARTLGIPSRRAIFVAYLILLVPIAAAVAFVRWAGFDIEAHRTARLRPADESPSLPG